MKKSHILLGSVMLLITLLLACETSGGYTEMGSATHSKLVNRKGTITKTIRKANGSATKEIEISDSLSSGTLIEIDVTLEVKGGSYKIEFLDDEEVALTLEAKPGQSATGSATVPVNSFGEIKYKATAVEAEKVKIVINLEVK